jgi:hypothetical protein
MTTYEGYEVLTAAQFLAQETDPHDLTSELEAVTYVNPIEPVDVLASPVTPEPELVSEPPQEPAPEPVVEASAPVVQEEYLSPIFKTVEASIAKAALAVPTTEHRELLDVFVKARVHVDVLGKIFNVNPKTLQRIIYGTAPANEHADLVYRKIPLVLRSGLEYNLLPTVDRRTVLPTMEVLIRLILQSRQLSELKK